jgi:asparagine synthase (glutamine-hydrolysing)
MCGIAGFWDPRRLGGKLEAEQVALRMAAALRHRGPDDQGAWADAQAGLALGHRRLAIVDLSSEGHQPMSSADGRYVVVFNGEIYNFQKLRRELEGHGHGFRGHSDTEVLLAAFCQWGVDATLQRCIGMFALALWDRQRRSLHLVRDRVGEKPLYYGSAGGVFVFGSELKALQVHPCWEGRIDQRALALLTRYGYIPAPFCIYQNIYKLAAGAVLTLTEPDIQSGQVGRPESYWSLTTVAASEAAQAFGGTEIEAKEQLRSLLLDSVGQQMVADVPLGAFLSGGIDSSLVVALMQAQSRRPIKTFSIGFHQNGFNEAPFAKAVARHLGTDHTELYLDPNEVRQAIYNLPGVYDEPFADSSQIPTVLLCRLARSQVTVSLSGDAGDELFGGYEGYRKAQRIWPLIGRVPRSIRGGIARVLGSFAGWGSNLGVCAGAPRRFLNRLANAAEVLPAASDRALHQLLMSPNRHPLAWLQHSQEPVTRFEDTGAWESLPDQLHRMMYLDFVSYLPDDILVKVDRAAMAVSLETRIPFLDHRIVEYAWTLPTSLKQKQGCGKWLLRQVLHEYVPRRLIDRPKQGFAVPIAEWLRGPLRSWAEALLSSTRLRGEGFFEEKTVRLRWLEHLNCTRDWSSALWPVLMFQAWLEQEQPDQPAAEVRPANVYKAAVGFNVCRQ